MAPLMSVREFRWQPTRLSALTGWRCVQTGSAEAFMRVVIDSRSDALAGALFVAIRGEHHDGHAFWRDAVARGATGVVVAADADLASLPADVWVFRVPDTVVALGRLATLRRRAFQGEVVAITGSAGKASTKRFAQTWLGRAAYASPGNFNNRIGVPLSLLEAPLDARVWLLELGMNHTGEIDTLTDICEPTVGVLLPAGRAHLGNLGSEAAVLAAKAELLQARCAPPCAILADSRYREFAPPGIQLISVGTAPDADYRLEQVRQVLPAGMLVSLYERRRFRLSTGLIGVHFGLSVAVAWAIGREVGVLADADAALAHRICPAQGRLSLHAYRGGWVLDDSYNASPESFTAFLDTVARYAVRRPVRLLVGDLAELGAAAEPIHDDLANRIARQAPTWLGVLGPRFAGAVRRAGIAAKTYDDGRQALDGALAHWRAGTVLAVKGAHRSGLYSALTERREARCSFC